jgi:HEAT repeat protein
VFLLDEPLLAGPLVASAQSFGPMYYNYTPGRPAQATVAARQKTSAKVTGSTTETVTLQQDVTLETLLRTGNEPRISGSTQTKFVLDRAEGWPRLVEVEGKSAALTENLSRSSVLSLKWQLLEGAEREAALTPPPPRPQEISAVDTAKLMTDLESDNQSARQTAACELTSIGRTVKPTPELLALGVKLSGDRDDTLRHAGQTLLANYGTREHVPVLLRALKEASDSSLRMTLAKGLGRLEDPRAAEPLAELIATGQSDQFSHIQRDTPVAEALVKIGPPAEGAVLALLKEKNADTRISACSILKQIGSKKSLSALKELTGNPVKELSEAAAEAARSIQGREKAN